MSHEEEVIDPYENLYLDDYILKALRDSKSITVDTLATILMVSSYKVKRRLKKLEKYGLVKVATKKMCFYWAIKEGGL